MARQTFVMRDGKLVPKCEAAPLTQRGPRSHLPTPYFTRDEIPPMPHPATGQIMTSLSEFRKVTKASGCVEVGNEKMPAYAPPPVEPMAKTISEAWDYVEQTGGDKSWVSETTSPELAAQSVTILSPPGASSREKAETKLAARQLGANLREAGQLPTPPAK